MTRQSILVPLDGSATAETALPYAATLALAFDDGLRLLSVVDQFGVGEYAERIEPLIEEGLRAHLHTVAEQLRASGLLVETAVRRGSPPETILAQAATAPTRAIVMCTCGMSGREQWLIGGVADKVVRLAPCPVLLVHPNGSGPDEPWAPRRLVVPLDGSERAEQVLPFAYDLARSLGLDVALARVQPWTASQVAAYGGYIPDIAALDELAAREAAGYLDGLRGRAPEGVRVERVVLRGTPAEQLADYAEQTGAGLIVMASRGHNSFRRLLLGSVTDRLIRHGLPVMVLHPIEIEEMSPQREADVVAEAATAG
jgi:nucleotide-binding universal stress UspA family protein